MKIECPYVEQGCTSCPSKCGLCKNNTANKDFYVPYYPYYPFTWGTTITTTPYITTDTTGTPTTNVTVTGDLNVQGSISAKDFYKSDKKVD